MTDAPIATARTPDLPESPPRIMKPRGNPTLADVVIFLGMAVNAVVIVLILYFYVF